MTEKTKLLILPILLLSLCTSMAFGQGAKYDWSYALGAQPETIVSWGDETVFIGSVGESADSLDLDPTGSEAFIPLGNDNLFFQLLDSSMNLQSFGGISTTGGFNFTKAIYRCENSLYIIGRFYGTADFDPGPDSIQLTNIGGNNSPDMFVLELDSLFRYKSVYHINTDDYFGEEVAPLSADVLPNCNLVVAGFFEGIINLGNGPDTVLNPSLFLVEINDTDSFVDYHKFSGIDINEEEVREMCVDSPGNIYLTGSLRGTLYFGSDTIISGPDEPNLYVVKLSDLNSVDWVKKLEGGKSFATDIAAGPDSLIYILGNFIDSVDADPGPGQEFIVSSVPGNRNPIVLKLTSSGMYNQIIHLKTRALEREFVIDTNNDLLLAGLYSNSMDADPGTQTYLLDGAGVFKHNGFVVKVSSTGEFIYAKNFRNEGGSLGAARCFNISTNHLSEPIVAGNFIGGFALVPGPGSLHNSNETEAFVVKFVNCDFAYDSVHFFACKEMISPSGRYSWDSTGTYTDYLESADGCDSILTATVQIEKNLVYSADDSVPGSLRSVLGCMQHYDSVHFDPALDTLHLDDSLKIDQSAAIVNLNMQQPVIKIDLSTFPSVSNILRITENVNVTFGNIKFKIENNASGILFLNNYGNCRFQDVLLSGDEDIELINSKLGPGSDPEISILEGVRIN